MATLEDARLVLVWVVVAFWATAKAISPKVVKAVKRRILISIKLATIRQGEACVRI